MIKLTTHKTNAHVTIRIDGRLDAEAVPEVRALLASLSVHALATLDLSGLTSLDEDGRALLVSLRARGHALTGGSMYVKTLLGEIQS